MGHSWDLKDDDSHGSRNLMISMAPCAGKDDDSHGTSQIIGQALPDSACTFSLSESGNARLRDAKNAKNAKLLKMLKMLRC